MLWSCSRLLIKPTPCAGPIIRPLHLSITRQNISKYQSEEEKEKISQNKKTKKRQLWASVAVGGFLAGGTYTYMSWKRSLSQNVTAILNDNGTKEFLLSEAPPSLTPSRSIVNPEDKTGLKITLYQYQTCPFCCKARAFLDYYGFSYDVIEVNSVRRKETKWSKYKKVPILVVEAGDKIIQVNDSSVIVSALFSFLAGQKEEGLDTIMDCYPTMRYKNADGKEVSEIQNSYFLMYNEAKMDRSKENIVEERRWRKWVDDVLVHTLSPNVYRTHTEALETFKWFSVVGDWDRLFSWWEKNLVIHVGAIAMLFIGKRLKTKYNLKDDVRQSFYDECNIWCRALKKKGTPFMGGDQPNLSDLAAFGVLNAVEGCEAFQDARNNTPIGQWFDIMKLAVKNREGKAMVAV